MSTVQLNSLFRIAIDVSFIHNAQHHRWTERQTYDIIMPS